MPLRISRLLEMQSSLLTIILNLLHNLFLKAVSLGWIGRNLFAFGFHDYPRKLSRCVEL